MTVRGSGKFPAAGADERPGNDSAHAVLPLQDLPGRPAVTVQFFQGHDLFMGRYLEHAVRRCIDDQIAACHMGIPIVLNHGRAGIGQVAEHASSRPFAESLNRNGNCSS